MWKPKKTTYDKHTVVSWPIPNYWDALALFGLIGLIALLGFAATRMFGPYHLGQPIPISLDPSKLPYYALRSVLRMLLALLLSLTFTFTIGTWAAKSRAAERIIIPAIDVLQSVPVLAFLTFIAVILVRLTPNSLFGAECASIFAIFTAQVWNMTLSFYQSLRTVPKELTEAASMFKLNAWQRFWRLEVPFSMPGLLWNTMMSMSGSWVFLVASEAFTVANQNITLPGIGSYIALATQQSSVRADIYALVAMLIVIIIYDQLMFRPLVAWAEKFKTGDTNAQDEPDSWILNLFQRSPICQRLGEFIGVFSSAFVNLFSRGPRRPAKQIAVSPVWQRSSAILVAILQIAAVVAIAIYGFQFIRDSITWHDVTHTILLGFYTGARVTILIIICALIWVPCGVWIGLRPRVAQIVQPIAQFFAAFPINLLFPFAIYAIIRFHLNFEIWCAPLMVLGTQWYILFNIIAGASAIPQQLHNAADAFQCRGWQWWRRLILPATFPYFITGAITASGGAWNISIIAEALSWGHKTVYAQGLGAYITQMAAAGDYDHLALGVIVMSLYVVLINRLLWRPLYKIAEERYQIR